MERSDRIEATILSHKSLEHQNFLTFNLCTFFLTQLNPSPSPVLTNAYFGALRRLQYTNQHCRRENAHKYLYRNCSLVGAGHLQEAGSFDSRKFWENLREAVSVSMIL